MNVYGLDFTSAPGNNKPITCARCSFNAKKRLLTLIKIENFYCFNQFDDFLQRKGPWIAGIDFPFGQSRTLVTNIAWPTTSWADYVSKVASMCKIQFENALEKYK